LISTAFKWFRGILIAAFVGIGLADGALAQPLSTGIVLIYHRFGENSLASTNIRLDQFDAHIEELLTPGKYIHPRLEELLAARLSGVLYDRPAVVITADDGYTSIYEEAWPRLKAAGIPLTIFIATDPIDGGGSNYMDWDQIRALVADGVTIAHHGASHFHMLDASAAEIREDLQRASRRFAEELGFVPKIFAYPYGEYDPRLMALIEAQGFDYAFAQFSGPLPLTGSRWALPRFPMNEQYGEISRFRLVSGTLPLPVSDIIPQSPVLAADDNPPGYGFTLDIELGDRRALTCFPSHMATAANLQFIGDSRVEVRFDQAFPGGRNRINCTAPADDGRWYWLGKLFIVPE
jgi:peptidoglycan/xylan/chitin deacetylase (PgdA/CDA1 family)